MKMKNEKWKIKFLTSFILLLSASSAFAFEDVIVTNNSKLTEIKIENHDIIDVFPLITIMNDKNTLIVHPLKEGNTNFTALKDNKNLCLFTVKVEADRTIINSPDGFDILPIDYPPEIYEYELDLPPVFAKSKPKLR